MKVSKHTGLVSVIIEQAFRGYVPGAVARFSPEDAQKYLGLELVKEADATGETVTVKSPAATLDASQILPQALPAIPEDWERLHQLQRLQLAIQIAGRPVQKIGE